MSISKGTILKHKIGTEKVLVNSILKNKKCASFTED